MDYADQRYYVSSYGRFNTPDPMAASANAQDPGTWNRYAYVAGDPVNRNDRRGLCLFDITNNTPYDSYDDWENAVSAGTAGDGDDVDYMDGGCTEDGFGGDGGGGVSDPDPIPCLSQAFVGSGCAPVGTPILWKRPTKLTTPKCPPQYQAWISAYGVDAVGTGLSEANVLALSAIESGWGGGRFAQGGNSFFNLETLAPTGWKPGDPFPNTIYVDQLSWMNASEPFMSGPYAGRYSLVATYQNASDAFASFAANDGRYFSGVTNAATFGGIAVAHGIYGGRGNGFVTTEQTFQNCLGAQKQ